MSTLCSVGIGGAALAGLNALFWLAAYAEGRRWKYIGAEARRWCLRRDVLNGGLAVLNGGLAVLFAMAGVAGWYLAV